MKIWTKLIIVATCNTPTPSTTICMTSDGCSSTALLPSGTKYSCNSGQTLVAVSLLYFDIF